MNNNLPARLPQPTGLPAIISGALSSARVSDTPIKQLEYVLAQAMAKAFADTGQKVDNRADDITYLVQTMPGEVLQHLPAIRIDEIPIAINRGVLHHFGDFYGLNVATFMRFLQLHYQCSERAMAIKSLPVAEPQPAAPTATELHHMRLNRIAEAYKTYQRDGHYNDYGNLVFNSINAMGKIPFSEAHEAHTLTQAKQNLIAQNSKVSIYPHQRAKLKANLAEILSGNSPNLIIAEAKRITLFEFFDYLIESGTDVLEYLTKE